MSMKALLAVVAVALAGGTTAMAADKDKIVGTWELTKEVAGMPQGTTWEFRGDGKLLVEAKGKMVEFNYQVIGKIVHIEFLGKKDTTGIQQLDDNDLVLKDKDGTTAIFK